MKEILNIVIYKCFENGIETKKSCIFYSDGSVQEGNYEDGIKAIKEVSKKLNITSKEELKEMVNKNIIYTMSEEEFNDCYNVFLLEEKPIESKQEHIEFDSESFAEAIRKYESIGILDPLILPGTIEQHVNMEKGENSSDSDEEIVVYEEEVQPQESNYIDFTEEEEKENFFNKGGEKLIEKVTIIKEKDKKYKGGISGIIVCGIVTGLLVGCCTLTRCSKTGTMIDNNIKQGNNSNDDDLNNMFKNRGNNKIPYGIPPYRNYNYNYNYNYNNNDSNNNNYTIKTNTLYNDYKFTELLNVTKNDFQKTSMINLDTTITNFNGNFANKYLESGHDIKAALTFDEVVALQQAYNSYTKDEVRAYFNGYEVNAIEMSNNYKSASLQLMGAYIIENSENPVDITNLIDSQEGKDFYNRYHAMYLKAKEATGEEQLKLVKEFYDNVRKDFPITDEVREEGISHADDHNSIKSYKLSVIPMIDAAERIFQNLKVDYTLGSSEDKSSYNYMNSIGLCNYADDKFERIETITLSSNEDGENPTYIQYRKAIINELVTKNEYFIDDEHRELSDLRRFQEIVNKDPLYKHRKQNNNGNNTDNKTPTPKTWTGTSTSTKTISTSRDGGEMPEEKKAEVDKKVEEENKKAKEEAEKKAKENTAKAQEEANKNKQTTESEVKKENEKTQNDINNINNGKTTNNSNINISDNNKDKNGNVNNSVKNITTDGSGANEPLPDPNEYGKNFDERVKVKTK